MTEIPKPELDLNSPAQQRITQAILAGGGDKARLHGLNTCLGALVPALALMAQVPEDVVARNAYEAERFAELYSESASHEDWQKISDFLWLVVAVRKAGRELPDSFPPIIVLS